MAPNYTNTATNYTFVIVNKNSIPAGGSLQLTFNGYAPTTTSLTLSSPSALVNTTITAVISGNVYFLPAFFRSTIPAGTSLTFSMASLTCHKSEGLIELDLFAYT